MSQEQFAQFRAKVSQSPSLQEQLQGATDQKQFVQLFVKLGSENGHLFSPSNVEDFINSIQDSVRDGGFDDALLEAVAGGAGRVGNMPSLHPLCFSQDFNSCVSALKTGQ